MKALREVGIEVSHDETAKAAQFTGKDFKSADVTYFAKTYNGSAYFVLALSKIGGKIDRALGIADSEGRMVANAEIGNLYTYGGGASGAVIGAAIGSAFIPPFGTYIGFVIGGITVGYASGKIVEYVFIVKI